MMLGNCHRPMGIQSTGFGKIVKLTFHGQKETISNDIQPKLHDKMERNPRS